MANLAAWPMMVVEAPLMALRLSEEKGRQKVRHCLIDQWQSGPASPGEVGVDANRHDSRLPDGARKRQPKERSRRPLGRA